MHVAQSEFLPTACENQDSLVFFRFFLGFDEPPRLLACDGNPWMKRSNFCNMTSSSSSAIDWSSELEQHRPWLAKVLRCRIGDRHEVDDLLQEIALAVFRQSNRRSAAESDDRPKSGGVPSDPSKVAPWLYRIAVRQAVNFHRKSHRKTQAQPVPDLEVSARSPEPLDWMMAKEQSRHLNDAIDRLRPQQREILTLKYTENWSYQQLADHLGIPVRSVEYRLLQARKQLRNYIVNGVTTATPRTAWQVGQQAEN
jgi:RNA polymerase sigma factor (sigma-70 family)